MSIFLTIACLVIILVLVKSIFQKKNERLYQLLKQFPSHQTYPLIGNLHLLLNPRNGMLEKIEKVVQPFDRQVFWFGPIPFLILKKYDDIATILSQCLDRDMMGLADDWMGVGLITARYENWKTSRRILNPAFSSEMLAKYLQVFKKNASALVDDLKSVADTDESVNVIDWMMKASLDSIVENSLGISIGNSGENEQNFCNAIHVGLKSGAQRIVMPWLFLNHVYKLYIKITKMTKSIEHLNLLPAEILRKKLNELQSFEGQISTVADANSSRTVIDLLIKKSLKEPDFTEIRMRDELLQIIGAGIETTAVTLSFLMLMLAINQDVQQKLYEEITHFPTLQDGQEDTLTENDLSNHLGYLEQCIKETVRMFSPVVASSRRTEKEILLNDKIVPANVLIVTMLHSANMDPELYKNPLKWDPEHFSDQAVKERPKTSQLGFGNGPRSCIGAKYAMMTMKTQIVYILRNYHLSTNIKEITKNDLYMDLSIRSKLGYPVKFESRQEAKTRPKSLLTF